MTLSTTEDEPDIVQPITRIRRSQNELHYSDYKHRLSEFEEKRFFRQNTISQLKEETKHENELMSTYNQQIKKYNEMHEHCEHSLSEVEEDQKVTFYISFA